MRLPGDVEEWLTWTLYLLGLSTLAVVLASIVSCAALEKLATPAGANGARATIREACAELAAADRVAGVLLDDAGQADAGAP